MDRNRRNKRYSNWNNQKNQDSQNRKNQNFNNNNNKEKSYQFNHTIYQNDAAERERQKAISEIKTREVKCGICGELISDIASAITDKSTGKTVHFDCILDKIAKEESSTILSTMMKDFAEHNVAKTSIPRCCLSKTTASA